MGLGTGPKEEFSHTLIIVILVGVGLPLVLLVSACVFLGIKKYRHNEELLLGSE